MKALIAAGVLTLLLSNNTCNRFPGDQGGGSDTIIMIDTCTPGVIIYRDTIWPPPKFHIDTIYAAPVIIRDTIWPAPVHYIDTVFILPINDYPGIILKYVNPLYDTLGGIWLQWGEGGGWHRYILKDTMR